MVAEQLVKVAVQAAVAMVEAAPAAAAAPVESVVVSAAASLVVVVRVVGTPEEGAVVDPVVVTAVAERVGMVAED